MKYFLMIKVKMMRIPIQFVSGSVLRILNDIPINQRSTKKNYLVDV